MKASDLFVAQLQREGVEYISDCQKKKTLTCLKLSGFPESN
ncbi:MAG: hypothetical protein WB014_09935 [Methanosarcina sp.]